MKHLDEGELQALLDGEMSAADARAAEAHLAGCVPCTQTAAELRMAREVLVQGLSLTDVAPPVAAAQMSLRARRARAARWSGEGRRALARAAALVALVAGAASAAVPGVRWLREVAAPSGDDPAPAPVVPTVAPVAPVAASGVSIFPEGGAVQVVLHGPARGLRVRTRLQPGGRAEVSATGLAADARFRTGPGRIEVSDAGPGEILVVLPTEATAALVEIDGRTVFAKDGGRLRALAGARATTSLEAEFEVGS